DAQAWRRARGKPVHPRISLRRVQTDPIKLDGVGGIELAIAFPDDRDRLRLPVDVELQVARVCVWSKTDGQKLGLRDAIPAFVINENLDGKLRRETEGRRRLTGGNFRRRGPCLDRPRWRVGSAQTGKFGGPGL